MLSRAAQLVSYKVASEVAGKAAILAVLILSARRLTTAEFAVLSLATMLGWMASVASDFGLHLFLGRAITRTTNPAAVLWPLFHVRVRAASAALFLIALLAWALAPSGTWLAFMFIAAAPLISSVAEFLNYAYRGLGRSELESGLSVAQRLSTLVLATAGLYMAPTVLTVGVALIVSAFAALAASLVIAHRVVRSPGLLGLETQAELRSTQAELRTPQTELLTGSVWMREVAPIGVGLVLGALYFRIDVFLLEQWSGLEAVAQYSAVFRLVDAMRLAPIAVLTVVLPRLFGARDLPFASRLAAGLTGFAVCVTLVSWPMAPWLVRVAYGAEYAEAVPILQVLLLSFPLLTLNYSLTNLLIGWDLPREFALSCLAALAANLALNAWLIPSAGGIGAAWATLGTEVVVTAMCLVALYRAHTSR